MPSYIRRRFSLRYSTLLSFSQKMNIIYTLPTAFLTQAVMRYRITRMEQAQCQWIIVACNVYV